MDKLPLSASFVLIPMHCLLISAIVPLKLLQILYQIEVTGTEYHHCYFYTSFITAHSLKLCYFVLLEIISTWNYAL